MRLIQLARKLDIAPSEIIKFIEQEGISISERGTNTKFDDALTSKVLEHFNPQLLSETPDEIEEPGVETEVIPPPDEEKAVEEAEHHAPKEEQIPEPEPEKVDEVEVIRAKMIKLQGIKVVGKIDLPEPPKKSEPIEEEVTDNKEEAAKESTDSKRKKRTKPRRSREEIAREKQQRSGGSSRELSYEEKLKRKERAKQRKRQKLEKLKKEQKRQRYLSSIQQSGGPNTKKKAEKNVENPAKFSKKAIHRNPFRRFWAWLNGEYDDF